MLPRGRLNKNEFQIKPNTQHTMYAQYDNCIHTHKYIAFLARDISHFYNVYSSGRWRWRWLLWTRVKKNPDSNKKITNVYTLHTLRRTQYTVGRSQENAKHDCGRSTLRVHRPRNRMSAEFRITFCLLRRKRPTTHICPTKHRTNKNHC